MSSCCSCSPKAHRTWVCMFILIGVLGMMYAAFFSKEVSDFVAETKDWRSKAEQWRAKENAERNHINTLALVNWWVEADKAWKDNKQVKEQLEKVSDEKKETASNWYFAIEFAKKENLVDTQKWIKEWKEESELNVDEAQLNDSAEEESSLHPVDELKQAFHKLEMDAGWMRNIGIHTSICLGSFVLFLVGLFMLCCRCCRKEDEPRREIVVVRHAAAIGGSSSGSCASGCEYQYKPYAEVRPAGQVQVV